MKTAVVLAAGQGKRLLPLTRNRSKAMLPVAGKPIVARVIASLVDQGLQKIILVYSPSDLQIQQYFARLNLPGADVRMIAQSQPEGMADALLCAAPLLSEPFLLTACDNLVSATHLADLITHWDSSPTTNAILSLMPVDAQVAGQTGIVEWDGSNIKRIVEKPPVEQVYRIDSGNHNPPRALISSLPLYIFSTKILDYLPDTVLSPRGEYELQNAIQMLIEREGNVKGVLTDWRLNLTSVKDILTINRYFLVNEQPFRFPQEMDNREITIIPPVFIEEGVFLGKGSQIGPNVVVEGGCRLGEQISISESVLLAGAQVPDGAHITGQVLY